MPGQAHGEHQSLVEQRLQGRLQVCCARGRPIGPPLAHSSQRKDQRVQPDRTDSCTSLPPIRCELGALTLVCLEATIDSAALQARHSMQGKQQLVRIQLSSARYHPGTSDRVLPHQQARIATAADHCIAFWNRKRGRQLGLVLNLLQRADPDPSLRRSLVLPARSPCKYHPINFV